MLLFKGPIQHDQAPPAPIPWTLLRAGALATALLAAACGGEPEPPAAPAPAAPEAPPPEKARVPAFTEIAAESGLDFHHFLGATGEYYFAEIMGAGGALLDYDQDGDLDVYLVQGSLLGDRSYEDLTFETAIPLPPRNRLFRNDLIGPGGTRGELRFTDVTEASGAGDLGYGMGVAVGDIENDGDLDIYVTNFGPDVLLRNNGDGTFSDVTEGAGLGDPRWTASAAFLDYDADGFLDLYLTAYADFTLATNKPCYTPAGMVDYCGPTAYLSLPCRLYRNNGRGGFVDVTSEVGVHLAYGHGLGVVGADFDGNGTMDIYVANDSDMNQLWLNQGSTFQDMALLHGVAFNENGAPEAGMGIAVADHDNDGDLDLFVTHLIQESNRLYENLGEGFFEDATSQRGLAWPSLRYTGFGVGWFDFDHDADLDLYVVNGNVYMDELHTRPDYPFDQPNLLLINDGNGSYEDLSESAGQLTSLSEVSRGASFGDIDNDGDVDILVTNNNGPVRLFRNDLQPRGNWLVLRIVDRRLGRDAYGATVRLTLEDGRVLTRTVRSDGSYMSSMDPRVHLAWPEGIEAAGLEIALPGGPFRKAPPLEPGRHLTILAGGEAPEIRE